MNKPKKTTAKKLTIRDLEAVTGGMAPVRWYKISGPGGPPYEFQF